MSRKFYLVLVTLLASGLIAAACGDDDDDAGDSNEPAQTQETSGGAAEDTGGDAEDTGGDATAENVEQAVEDCKQAVTAAPQLSADVKSDLEAICEDAAEGDEDAVRQASIDVCVKIIEDTVPAGPSRDTGVKACEDAAVTP